MDHPLRSLGWSDFFEGACRQAQRPDLICARVVADYGRATRIQGADFGPILARSPPELSPCVGDWVLCTRPGGDEWARIEMTLVRRTELVRQAAGTATQRQTIAANIDVVFVVTALGGDLNLRRLERYLAAIHAGGAQPVIVLNKADLDFAASGRYVRDLPAGVPSIVTSVVLDHGIDELRAYLGPGRTGGFVGSSGVGKSSLVNALAGRDVLKVSEIRQSDGTGRHTTTHRELVMLPDAGGVLIDTPGMRELALWDGSGVDVVFEDLEALADHCAFRDCGHQTEPGCALLQGIEDGEVEAPRLASWLKLREQARRQAIRKDPAAARAENRRLGKMYRKAAADRKRRRG